MTRTAEPAGRDRGAAAGLDVARLRTRYTYNPESGEIVGPAGKPIGHSAAGDRRVVSVRNDPGSRPALVCAHRLAFALTTGRWPVSVRHRNGDRSDNRWTNLQEVTRGAALAGRPKVAGGPPTRGIVRAGSRWRVHYGRHGWASFGTAAEAVALREVFLASAAAGVDPPPLAEAVAQVRANAGDRT